MFLFLRDELIGKGIDLLLPSLFDSENEPHAPRTAAKRITEFPEYSRELLARRKNGTTFPVDLAWGRVDHMGLYTGILRDITTRKQLQSHILAIATEEQTRIGQELHDGTQQELTGLSLFSGSIKDILDNAIHRPENQTEDWILCDDDYQRIKQTLAKLTKRLIEANHHVHKLSHGIMPVQIDAQGLQAALYELATSTNANEKITCRFDFVGIGTICDNVVATQLYRIAQESLTNSIKHGHSTEILISLTQNTAQAILEISDNGIGFDPTDPALVSSVGSGLGLRIMKYRASVLGGDLRVTRNRQNGTSVYCSIPARIRQDE